MEEHGGFVKCRLESLLAFLLRFWRPHFRVIAASALCMTSASILATAVPLVAKSIVTFDEGTTEDSVRGGGRELATFLDGVSDTLFIPVVRCVVVGVEVDAFVLFLLCRCLLLVTVLVLYNVISCAAHLLAYQAASAVQTTMTVDAVETVLSTSFPERVTVVSSVRLSRIITSSAKAAGETLGVLLTDVLSCVLTAVAVLGVLLYISTPVTLTIGVLVGFVQYCYYVAGGNQNTLGERAAAADTNVLTSLTNTIRRCETIRIFHCKPFVLSRLSRALYISSKASSNLNLSIHGYAALSSGTTNLVFVLVLGMCSYYHRRGDIEIADIAMYFIFLRTFVSTLVSLATEISKTRATMGGLLVLKSTLEWYAEKSVFADRCTAATMQRAESMPQTITGRGPSGAEVKIVLHGDDNAEISLVGVGYQYPTIPPFLAMAEGGALTPNPVSSLPASPTNINKGISNVSLSVQCGTITSLYGPSGSGKSTCLRLLSGLVPPHCGTVNTLRHAVLLEQQHAIFIGTIAENILLKELDPRDGTGKTEDHDRVLWATQASGCAGFLTDPFTDSIENVDLPPYSGGQLQRICLARVFGQRHSQCSLVLLDEPTTGLDEASVTKLLSAIMDLRDVHKKTVLIATHDHRVAQISDCVIRF